MIYVSIQDQRMRYPADGPEAIEQVEIEDERRRVSNLPRVAGTLFQWYSKLEEQFGYHYRVVEDDEFCRTYDVRETLERRPLLQEIS
jgi:hypothetical protein